MRPIGRLATRGAGLAIAGVMIVAIAALTRVSYAPSDAERALLRLSWRARGEMLENCRRATAEELAPVPAHMRQEVICSGERVAPYALLVEVDGRAVIDGPVEGSDVEGDRPMYILHDIPLEPGAHAIRVRIERRGDAGERLDNDDDEDDEDDENDAEDASRDVGDRQAASTGRRQRRRAIPPLLTLDTTVAIGRGEVRLVTYDAETGRLVLLGGAPATR